MIMEDLLEVMRIIVPKRYIETGQIKRTGELRTEARIITM